MVISKNKIKVAQYGQWDGYIEGQGLTIAKFISKLNKYKSHIKFKKQVDALQKITQAELIQLWEDCGADPESSYVSIDVSNTFERLFPQFHRNTGAKILDLIMGGLSKVNVDVESANESYIEYVYVLNLDKKELEIYTGRKIKQNLYKTLKFSKVSADSIKKLAKEFYKQRDKNEN